MFFLSHGSYLAIAPVGSLTLKAPCPLLSLSPLPSPKDTQTSTHTHSRTQIWWLCLLLKQRKLVFSLWSRSFAFCPPSLDFFIYFIFGCLSLLAFVWPVALLLTLNDEIALRFIDARSKSPLFLGPPTLRLVEQVTRPISRPSFSL